LWEGGAHGGRGGTALRRAGRVHVDDDGERIWVGGDCVTSISGVVAL
jgi:hypothetical protein